MVDEQVLCLQQAQIGRDHVAGRESHDIAWDQRTVASGCERPPCCTIALATTRFQTCSPHISFSPAPGEAGSPAAALAHGVHVGIGREIRDQLFHRLAYAMYISDWVNTITARDGSSALKPERRVYNIAGIKVGGDPPRTYATVKNEDVQMPTTMYGVAKVSVSSMSIRPAPTWRQRMRGRRSIPGTARCAAPAKTGSCARSQSPSKNESGSYCQSGKLMSSDPSP